MIRTGSAAGHFGEWLQGRLGPEGPVVLVTVACPALRVRAHLSSARTLSVRLSDGPPLPPAPLTAFLTELDLPAIGAVTLGLDMPPGGGAGASTAALIALARAAGGTALAPETLARACHRAEGASDPTMHAEPDAHLWSPREGLSLGALPRPPAAEIVGGFLGAPVATDAADTDFPDVADLIEGWRAAAARGDLPALAALAARSARRTGARRGPDRDPTPALAARLGALGHLRAHTGSARGLIYAPGTAPGEAETALRAAGFENVLRFRTGAQG